MRTSVILPTRDRPERARACVERCLHTARGYDCEVVVVTEDEATRAAMAGLRARVLYSPDPSSAPEAWYAGAAGATGDVLVLGADDLWFYHGWIGEMLDCMAALPEGAGVVGLNDLARDGFDHSTHWAVHRRFAVSHLGGVIYPPCYHHFFGDDEVNLRAKRAGRFVWAQLAIVEHRHPILGKAAVDALYERKETVYEQDQALFEQRLEAGFPDVWEPAFGI